MPPDARLHVQAFLDSSKAHAPFRPQHLAGPPPGAALSLADQRRVRDRSTIMARQMFAEQGAAYADEQVGRLLAALNIDPHQLPAEGPGLGAASWDRIYGAAAPRLGHPSAVSEHAAGAAMAAQHQHQQQWAQEFERLRLGEAGPSGSSAGWAAEYQQQQQLQQPRPAGWADEFAAAEEAAVGDSTGWVNEFQSTAAAGSALRQRAAGDALEQTRKLADTLAGGLGVLGGMLGWLGGSGR